MTRRLQLFLVSILLTIVQPVLVFADNSDSPGNTCIECHQDKRFFVQHKRIYDYYQDWLESPHQQAGVVCDKCHGGNPAGKTKAEAHTDTLSPSDSKSRVFFRNQPTTCGKCHEREVKQFVKSEHYRGLMGDSNAPTCSTCHQTMNRKPYYTTIVESTCTICHYEGNDDDLPVVGKQVTQILQRLNIAKAYLNWTSTYFREKNWPGDSKAEVESLERNYKYILTSGHSFDLSVPDEASVKLLTRLKQVYQEVENSEK